MPGRSRVCATRTWVPSDAPKFLRNRPRDTRKAVPFSMSRRAFGCAPEQDSPKRNYFTRQTG